VGGMILSNLASILLLLFFYMSAKEGKGGSELMTFASLGVVPTD
jgi:hypothetical protein